VPCLDARKDGAVLRTAIRSAGVVGVLAVSVSVAGCGPVQMGAAAIVGGQRIATATLASNVAALDRVYQANPAVARQVQYTPGQMPQFVLQWMVRFRVIDDVASHDGVRVTPAEAQRTVAALTQQYVQQSGATKGTAQFAVFNALPPPLISQYGRYVEIISKLASLYTGLNNVSSLTPAQQQVFSRRINAEVAAAAKRLDIKINPRFGQLNVGLLGIFPASDTLSRPAPS
jgi:SurA-like protein